MADNAIAFTPSDLTSMVSADDMAELNSIPEDGVEASSGEDAVETVEAEPEIDSPAPIGDEQADEPEQEAEAEETEVEAAPEPKAEAKTGEELPDGVASGKNRKGEEGYFVKADRWNNSIYPAHKTLQQISEVLGEPATVEALQLRNDAYVAQERMYNDLTSGDPAAQAAVFDYMIGEMRAAKDRGEVGVDPTVSMAQAVYNTLKEKSPDGYANLRFTAAKDLIQEMYHYAAERGDKNLYSSAQHFSRALANVREINDVAAFRQTADRAGIPFYTPEEMEGLAKGAVVDQAAALRAENERLKAEINGRSVSSQAATFENWKKSTDQAIGTGISDDAIKPALASVENGWKQHPEDYQELVIKPLTARVNDVIKADANFRSRIQTMVANAQRATSQSVRDSIAAQIRQAHINRANLVIEKEKFAILDKAAKTLAGKSATTHARRQAAQSRTAPASVGSVPRQTLPDNLGEMPGGVFDPKLAARQAARLLGA